MKRLSMALVEPGVGLEGGRGVYLRLMLIYNRIQHSIVKQLPADGK